jgi:hypothetical protein
MLSRDYDAGIRAADRMTADQDQDLVCIIVSALSVGESILRFVKN